VTEKIGFETAWKIAAGPEASPTGLFMIYGWAARPMNNCLEKFLRTARGRHDWLSLIYR
jgi:hypothetical protein